MSCAPCVTTPGLHASLSLLPHIHIIISSHWMTPKLTTLLVLHDTPSSVKRWHWSGVKRRKTLWSRDIFAVKTMHWFHSCKMASNNWANQNIWEVHWCGGSVLHLTCSPLAFGTTLLSSMSHLLPSSILSTSSFACWGEKRRKKIISRLLQHQTWLLQLFHTSIFVHLLIISLVFLIRGKGSLLIFDRCQKFTRAAPYYKKGFCRKAWKPPYIKT